MAFHSYLWGLYFSVLLSPMVAEDQAVEVVQPQGSVSVIAGETLRLECTVTGAAWAGPVKWFLGEGPSRKLIYADVGSFERVTRNNKGSDTDFSISIHNVSLEDNGTYYCVKQKKEHGQDKDVKTGRGTQVTVKTVIGAAQDIVPAVAGAASVLLVALLIVAVYFYAKKKRGRNCCNPRSELEDTLPQDIKTPKETSGDKEIVYADLKDPSGTQRPKQSNPDERSEYATIWVAQSVPG